MASISYGRNLQISSGAKWKTARGGERKTDERKKERKIKTSNVRIT